MDIDKILQQLQEVSGSLREKMFFLADFYVFEFIILAMLYVVIRTLSKMNWRTIQALSSLEKDIGQINDNVKEFSQEGGEEAKNSLKKELTELQFSTKAQESSIAEVASGIQRSEENILNENKNVLREILNAFEQSRAEIKDFGETLAAQKTEGAQQPAGGEEVKALMALIEKQGVYLYDQFAALVAAQTEQGKKLGELSELSVQPETKSGGDGAPVNEELLAQAVDRMTTVINERLDEMLEKINRHISAEQTELSEKINQISRHVSTEQTSALEQINKLLSSNARLPAPSAASAEARLPDILASCLQTEAYTLNADINGHAAAALLTMPGGGGAIALDDSLNLAEMRRILDDGDAQAISVARVRFGQTLTAHIDQIADTLIAPPTTGARAFLFVPSEPAYAEIQSNHRAIVDLAAAKHVSIVSPTTLPSVLNAARAQEIVDQARNFENQLQEIGDYIGRAMRSVKRDETAGVQLVGRMRGDDEGGENGEGEGGEGGGGEKNDNIPL